MSRSKSTAREPIPDQAPGATLTITPQVDSARLALYASAAASELEALSPLVITDHETAEVIARELQTELGRIDEMTAMKKEAATPIAQLKKVIDGWFKPGLDAADTLVGMYKRALAAWAQVQSAEREAALLRAGAAATSGDVPALTQALVQVNAPDQKPQGISYIEKWKARVCNPKLVPYEWLIPNQHGLDLYAAGFHGGSAPNPIPGVIFEKETAVRSSHGG